MNNWIKTADKLPPEDEKVIVCCTTKKGLRNINLAYQVNGFWHGNGSMAGVTHWQPLPELPKGERIMNNKYICRGKRKDNGK